MTRITFDDGLKAYALPAQETARTALDYHQIPILVAGRPNQEPLVDLASYGIRCSSAYAQANAPYYRAFPSALPAVYVRKTVADKLVQVNVVLRRYEVELLALDGFRPVELQVDLWEHFIEKGRQALVKPTDADLVAFAGRFCSDPRGFDPGDFRTWPVHNTGGAIDVTLRGLNGDPVFMGSIYDDADDVSKTAYFENQSLTSQSAHEARLNRRLLFFAMSSAGFANYPHEWWHFDYWTQMWVMNGRHDGPALYGRAELP